MDNYKRYTELAVWIEARKLVSLIYATTKLFPKDELFSLVSQLRRCVVSIPSNIAEGCGRNHTKDTLQFLYISRGSLYELETQIYLSIDLKYIDEETLNITLNQIETVRKLLSGFMKYYYKLES